MKNLLPKRYFQHKNSKQNLVYISQGGLSLGERDYYLEADSATVGIRKAYRDYIQRLFELTGDDTATASGKADAVLRLETAIARPSYSATQRRDTEANYHKMAYADLKADYPTIDWDTYFNLLGFPAFTEVCVSQPEPIQAVGTLWTDTPIDDLKTYTSFKLINSAAGALSDELAVYHNIDAGEDEIKRMVRTLQTFDPAGIGARDLRECLLLQIRRKPKSEMRRMMEDVVTKCFDEFMNKRWDKISAQLGYDADTAARVHAELLKLNPKPGSALGETDGQGAQQITPDFIVDTADDGTVTFTVNNGRVPELYVSESFADMVKAYQKNKAAMNRRDKEALLYAKEKVERAQGFIDAVKQRRHTLYVTMKAIVDIQRRYFQDGDESDLKPMILKDVAERAGLDISTVSRVSNMKYAQTRWGTFRLRHFFSDSVKTGSGEEMSTRRVKAALRDIIDKEDKSRPLSDDAIKDMMTAQGYPVARRTIAKYREQMGIPVARLRKQ